MSNPFSSRKTIVAENLNATYGIRDHVRDLSGRKRLCWKCQKDKPYRKGTLTKSKGKGKTTFSSTDKFICHDCRPPKESTSETHTAQPQEQAADQDQRHHTGTPDQTSFGGYVHLHGTG